LLNYLSFLIKDCFNVLYICIFVVTEKLKIMNRFLLIVFLFLMVSCKPEKRVITIAGTVSDPSIEQFIQGIEVSLFIRSSTNGTFSYSFVKQESITTDANGNFSFQHTYNYTTAYKLEFNNENYFSDSFEFQSEVIPNDDIYQNDFYLYPKAGIKINVVNQFPFDENDKIKIRIVDWQTQCEACCYTGFYEMIGIDIDETIECNIYGETEYTIEYLTWKNGNQNASHKIVFCPAFETTEVEISF